MNRIEETLDGVTTILEKFERLTTETRKSATEDALVQTGVKLRAALVDGASYEQIVPYITRMKELGLVHDWLIRSRSSDKV
ncbi:MAG: hypothetical protein A2751_05400 [Candidatus Doudnabacteria bacterium RIFCSPHIGHO2_01_FULL_46_14]|uniref:Uncharacterized protein n=1 Tax=Candidatus Doudnabacteria bacterium RIFCSPHIGHO2_01_FULL_46_14 TaxID=1817824 RepID=A0A1F5NP84_9BACT|nr:MAG: hypothetical protein A2751_05400 [Candidatus Doudnabacteria bacterium RIFCSPHIGHO2_01_FULL_46_14]